MATQEISLTNSEHNQIACSLNDAEIDQLAITSWQLCREVLIVQWVETDAALNYRVSAFGKIIREVGAARFQEAMVRCLEIYSKPWDITLANVRREAGLDCSPTKTPTVEAWSLVTKIVTRHVVYDANGCAILQPKVRVVDGAAVVEPVPEIPDTVSAAVKLLGGWQSLKEAHPVWWTQRFQLFRECFRPES